MKKLEPGYGGNKLAVAGIEPFKGKAIAEQLLYHYWHKCNQPILMISFVSSVFEESAFGVNKLDLTNF